MGHASSNDDLEGRGKPPGHEAAEAATRGESPKPWLSPRRPHLTIP